MGEINIITIITITITFIKRCSFTLPDIKKWHFL